MVRFRWITRVGFLVGLVASLVAVPSVGGAKTLNPAMEQSTQSISGTFSSSITVLNPSNSGGNANITVDFYAADGAKAGTVSTTSPVAPGGTAFWYVPNISGLPVGTYSAVVSSDQQVYATVNLGSVNPVTGETYNGVDGLSAANVALVPSVFQNYYGFTSQVVIQNANSSAQNVTVNFVGSSSLGSVNVTIPLTGNLTIPANASTTIDLSTYSAQLGNSFNGAATVTGTTGVAVIANNYTPAISQDTPNYLFSSANAFATGVAVTTAYVPGLYQNYHGFISALHVFNADTVANNILVTYSNGTTDSVSGLAPGASHLFYIPNNTHLPNGWLGSATVTSSNSKLLVATVDIRATGNAGVGLASYDGFAAGTSTVFAPGLDKNYHGFNSSLTIQNVDSVTAPAGSVVVTYSDGHQHSNATALGPGQNWQLYTPNEAFLANGFNGGATVTSGTAKIVGLVNISGVSSADQLFSTNAFGSN